MAGRVGFILMICTLVFGVALAWASFAPQTLNAAEITGSGCCRVFPVTDCESWFSMDCCPNPLHWCDYGASSGDPLDVCNPIGSATYCAGSAPECGIYGDWSCTH